MFVHSRFLLGIIALVSFILFISWRFTSNPSDDQLLSNWYPKNLKNQLCRRNTSLLIEQMRKTQRQLSSHIQKEFTSLDKRFKVMNPLFETAMSGFRYILQPFELTNNDETKYFLDLLNPQDTCNYVTLGVGLDWEAEKKMQKKYPQCQFLGADPVETNRKIVEATANSRFVLAAVSDTAGNKSAWTADNNYVNQLLSHRSLVEFLSTENKGNLIDYMTIDIEGPEFLLLKELHAKRAELPIICQLNVEIHYGLGGHNFHWDTVYDTLTSIFEESHYILLQTFVRQINDVTLGREFFLNVGDQKCVQKYIC